MLTEYGLPTTSASGFRQRKRKPSVVCFWSREAEDNVPACHHSGSGRMTSNREIVFRFLDPLPSARHHCDAKIVAYTSTTHFRVSGATSNEERRCRNNTRSLAARFTSTSVQIAASGSAQAILLAKIGAPAPKKRAFCPSRGPLPAAADSRAGAFDAVVGLRPSVGNVDWPRGAVAAGFRVGTLGCSSIAHDRNGCRRRKRRHSHDSYGFAAQRRTWPSPFQSRYTLHQMTMTRACGADDVEVFTPADVQKTTFSDDR
jgi:hypothetical protein